MNSKTMYILVAALVIVIVVAGIGIYLYMGTGGGGGGGGGGENTYTVSNATSVQYSVNFTDPDGVTGIYKFSGKDITGNLTLRVDIEGGGTTYSYIMNSTAEMSWANLDGTWAESDFATDWASWGTQWTTYLDKLKNNWSGTGDYSYTDADGNAILIYNISTSSLPDSLFQHS